jgi:hypothetical protein
MKYFTLILFLLASMSLKAQKAPLQESEKWQFESSINISGYNSLSISVEKEYTFGKFKFGPRVELLIPIDDITYQVSGDSNIYRQNAQIRLRLMQIEWCVQDRIRLGISPFWMLGPLPRYGYYKTPSSIYAHFDLDEAKTLSSEVSFSTTWNELIQISIRKVF